MFNSYDTLPDVGGKLFLGKFHHDLTVLPNPGIMVYLREIIPKWPSFRLVKYDHLARTTTKSCSRASCQLEYLQEPKTNTSLVWVNYSDLTATSLESLVYLREIIPFYGRSIQVSEILQFLPRLGGGTCFVLTGDHGDVIFEKDHKTR